MPKLNTTIDNLELKSNRVAASTPSASWTDAQYPSAKTLYSTYTTLNSGISSAATRCTTLETTCTNLVNTCNTLTSTTAGLTTTCNNLTTSYNSLNTKVTNFLNIAHPVGSVMITSTNANPASTVGGTWTLVDKSFKSVAASATAAEFFTPASKVTFGAAHYTRADHIVRAKITLTVNSAMSDTGMLLGTLNWAGVGVNSLPAAVVDQVTYRDGSNGGIVYAIYADSGEIQQLDVFDTDTIASGGTFIIDVTFVLQQTQMLDSACDKFYWKRTA